MNWPEAVLLFLEMVGTISFALSGAMTAIQKKADIFGVLFLGAVTAVGGGILRDIMLGKVPPTAFLEEKYVIAALCSSLVLFCLAFRQRHKYIRYEKQISIINNIFDAIGLGIFSVVGVQAAQAAELGQNLFFCLFLGLITGVGGGVIQSLMLGEIPMVLTKRIYAVASLAGSIIYCISIRAFPNTIFVSSIIGSAAVFLVRMLATRYRWDLPRAME